MIQDRLIHGGDYAFLGDNFAEAFKFLTSLKPEDLSPGRIDVKGSEVYALVQQYTSKNPADGFLETHKRYADIQVVLSGRERIDYCYAEGLKTTQPYSDEKDVEKYELKECSRLILEAGDFAVFFPQDAHGPQLAVDSPEEVLKVVMKVAL